jgi:hypothetical protein
MSEMETKDEVETAEFADELSDEALDRAEGTELACWVTGLCRRAAS